MISRGRLSDLDVVECFPGVRVRTFESDGATVNRYDFAPGATFPRHHHPQEQITLVESGEILFALDGDENVLRAGEWQIAAPDVPHRVTAGAEGAHVTAVLVPRRGTVEVMLAE